MSIMMVFLFSYSDMLFLSSLALIYKSPTISLNTFMNRLCAWMKFWVPDFHNLTTYITSSILLVDCYLFLTDYNSAFWNSAHKCCVDVLNSCLYFGIDAASGRSEKYVQVCHSSSMWLLSIYFSAQNLIAIIILLFSITSLHYCLLSWNVLVLRSCAFLIVPKWSWQIFFIIYAANIMSLGYWLFFLECYLASTFINWNTLIGLNFQFQVYQCWHCI